MPLLSYFDLVPGRILRRYQRFLADVELEDGEIVTAHCTNTGTMKSCWEPGDRVLLRFSPNPKRKLSYTWLACEREGNWVGVETGVPNRVVAEAARRDQIPGLTGLREVRTEQKYGENSRIDVWARNSAQQEVFLEVKNVTLKDGDWIRFPDAVTSRGLKHLRELQNMVHLGHQAVLVFFIHRGDGLFFDAARDIDPLYAQELERASYNGVHILPLRGRMDIGWPSQGCAWIHWIGLEGLPWIPK